MSSSSFCSASGFSRGATFIARRTRTSLTLLLPSADARSDRSCSTGATSSTTSRCWPALNFTLPTRRTCARSSSNVTCFTGATNTVAFSG